MAEIKKVTLQSGKVRYRTVVDAGRDENGKRIQLTITRDTKTEVKAERNRIEHQRSAGTLIVPSKITLGEWLDQWLQYKKRDVETTTIRTYRLALVHVYDRIGHVRLQELTEDQVQDCIDDIVANGRRKGGTAGTRLAVSTAEGVLTRLREALKRAAVRKLIAESPAQFVRVSLADRKTDKRERPEAKPWALAEVQKFIAGIERDRLYAPLLLSLMGLRPAEVVGLRWSDLDLKLATLEMVNTRTMIGNVQVLEKDAKTAAGERVLPLPGPVLDALKKFRALQARERLAAGEGYTDSGYVVVDQLGIVRNTRHLREHAYRLMRELEMRRVRLYDARHSCLSYLAVSGVPDVVLAAWAGHTNASFTKRKYVHVDVEDMRAAATAWDSFHGGDRKAPV
ncbi:site-specific integrase [Streptomyces phaeoluteigriseus]|uniref:Site-specific integrase n=1 Tax=Streptomyces phaeoluteigriseus TaxID=114686 RepID=A0ABY4ZFA8_9ACTN|nr:tyrosine-type recombinase/integrase [Streptomyces phaeoluteigriseus]USQ86967.1 site-specific integrase [Streptomyces phaeoluteigriseus]